MSFVECLLEQIEGKMISKADSDELLSDYQVFKDRLEKSGKTPEEAAIIAQEDILKNRGERLDQAREQVNQAIAIQNRLDDLMSVPANERDHKSVSIIQQVLSRTQTVVKETINSLSAHIEKVAPKGLAMARDFDLINGSIYRYLDGNLDDPLAKSFSESLKLIHDRYKRAGGKIGDALKPYFPQKHMKEAIRANFAGKKEWVDFIRPLLDERHSFRGAMKKLDVDEVLGEIYDDIMSGGLADLQSNINSRGLSPGIKKAFTERKSYSKMLYFKDSNSFRTYNNRAGVGEEGLFKLYLDYINNRSKDIALLERFGPDPDMTMRYLSAQLSASGYGPSKVKFSESLYSSLKGSRVGMEESALMNFVAGTKSLLQAATGGSILLTAIPDIGYVKMTAKANGLKMTRVMKRMGSLLNPASKADRAFAVSRGYIIDAVNGGLHADTRFAGELQSKGWTQALSSKVFKYQGMTDWVRAMKDAMSLEGMAVLAENSGKTFKQLDPFLQGQLRGHGLTAEAWEKVKLSGYIEAPNGSKFLDPNQIRTDANLPGPLRTRAADAIDDWLFTMRDMASNENHVIGKYWTSGKFLEGTLGPKSKAVGATAFMYRSFQINQYAWHFAPMIRAVKNGKAGAKKNLAGLVGMTTMLGAFSLALGEIVRGRSPETNLDANFWLRALAKGGGGSFLGDAVRPRFFGDGFVSSMISNPMFGTIDDAADIVADGFGTVSGKNAKKRKNAANKFRRDSFRFIKSRIPGVNLWYTRRLLEKALLDDFEAMIDPQYNKRKKRAKKRMTERGQEILY